MTVAAVSILPCVTHLITKGNIKIFDPDVFGEARAIARVFFPPADRLSRRRRALRSASFVINGRGASG